MEHQRVDRSTRRTAGQGAVFIATTIVLAALLAGLLFARNHDDGTRAARFTILPVSDSAQSIPIDVQHDGCEDIERIKVDESDVLFVKIEAIVRKASEDCGSALITQRYTVNLKAPLDSRAVLGGGQ